MADVNIPDLTAASALDGTEKVEVVQAGVNKRTTTAAIAGLNDICGNAADPNVAGISPGNKQAGARYYQDPAITIYNEWKWSVTNQVWVQTISP